MKHEWNDTGLFNPGFPMAICNLWFGFHDAELQLLGHSGTRSIGDTAPIKLLLTRMTNPECPHGA